MEENLKQYKDRLEEARVKIQEEISNHQKTVNFGSDVDGFDEESDETEELGNELAVSETYKNRLERIDDALKRIDNGNYGKCLECNSEISKEVLDTVPESEFCNKCKTDKRK